MHDRAAGELGQYAPRAAQRKIRIRTDVQGQPVERFTVFRIGGFDD
jgi:hypothetical protein